MVKVILTFKKLLQSYQNLKTLKGEFWGYQCDGNTPYFSQIFTVKKLTVEIWKNHVSFLGLSFSKTEGSR